jgi:hypothetical protein
MGRMQTRAYVDVGAREGDSVSAGVGDSVGAGLGDSVGAGEGADVGAGVGLHAPTARSVLPLTVRTTIRLVAAQIGLGPHADGGQHRRSLCRLAAQM